MSLLESVKLLNSINRNITTETLDNFFNDFDSKDAKTNEVFLTGLSEYYDPWFYYCGLCLTNNTTTTKLSDFLNGVNDVNALLDAYVVMLLCDDKNRHLITNKINTSLTTAKEVASEKKEALLLFLLDNEDHIESIGEVFNTDNRYYNSEIDFGTDTIFFSSEPESDYRDTIHFVIHVPTKFLKLDSAKGQKFHIHYALNLASSSSQIYNRSNRHLILSSFNFNQQNLLSYNFDQLNPIYLFTTPDDLIQYLGYEKNPKPFLSTFLNTVMSIDDKISFLDSLCAKNFNHRFFSYYNTGSKLYFDTAFLSEELGGIENLDFAKYPSYGKIVFEQILANFITQHDQANAHYNYNTIFYNQNSSQNLNLNSTTTISNNIGLNELRNKKILIKNWKTLFTKLSPLIQTHSKKNEILVLATKILARSHPTSKMFLNSLHKLFGDYTVFIADINADYFPDEAKITKQISEGLANIAIYSKVIISDLCEKGLFEKAGILLRDVSRNSYVPHNELIHETNSGAHTDDTSEQPKGTVITNLGTVYSTEVSQTEGNQASATVATHLVLTTRIASELKKTASTLHDHIKELLDNEELNSTDFNTTGKANEVHEYHRLFIQYPQLLTVGGYYIPGVIIADELKLRASHFSMDVVLKHSHKIPISISNIENILNHPQSAAILSTMRLRDVFETYIKNFSRFSDAHKLALLEFFKKDTLKLVNSKNNLETLFKTDRWTSKDHENNQILFVEFLIQTEGNLELFNSFVEVAKYLGVEISEPFLQNFYYLIDGSLDNLFNN